MGASRNSWDNCSTFCLSSFCALEVETLVVHAELVPGGGGINPLNLLPSVTVGGEECEYILVVRKRGVRPRDGYRRILPAGNAPFAFVRAQAIDWSNYQIPLLNCTSN